MTASEKSEFGWELINGNQSYFFQIKLPFEYNPSCKNGEVLLQFLIFMDNGKLVMMSIPLVIGTVPLHGTQQLPWLPPSYDQQVSTTPSAPAYQRQPSAPPIEYQGRTSTIFILYH